MRMSYRLLSLSIGLFTIFASESAAIDKAERRSARQSVVQIYGLALARGKGRKLDTLGWWGSGTVLNTEGWILTNFHVAYPTMNDSYPARALVVCYNENSDQPAIPLYRAKIMDYCSPVWWRKPMSDEVIDVADFALLKCASDMHGQDLPADEEPFAHKLEIGNSDALDVGDQMTAIGYPDYASGAPTWLDGSVSDIQAVGTPPVRVALGTSAAISHGNSGGAAIDENGRLVGVPTFGSSYGEYNTSSHGYVLPINNAKSLIAGTVPNTGLGAVVRGHVSNVATGAAVAGAEIYILSPGVKCPRTSVYNLSIAGRTESGPDGHFRLPHRLLVGKKYSVIVVADGYESFMKDDFFDVSSDQTLDVRIELIPKQQR